MYGEEVESGGVQSQLVFYRLPTAEWRTENSYEGEIVPPFVLRQMRSQEGLAKGLWLDRGTEVTDVTWKILLDWYEKKQKKKAAEEGDAIQGTTGN